MALSVAHPDILISVRETTDVATARRLVSGLAATLGLDAEDSGALAIVVTEAATNLVKHGGGGELIVGNVTGNSAPAIQILAMDRGKGMANVSRSLQDGYSTASSPGTGLGAISRMADQWDIYSAHEKGTVLMARKGPGRGRRPEPLEIGAVNVPYPGEEVSGDAWFCDSTPARARFALVDGLGHGILAAEAAKSAVQYVRASRGTPAESLESAHMAMRSTRGAAIAVADLEFPAGRATFAGAGNVAGAIIAGGIKRQMVSINGTLGHEMGKVRQYDYPFPRGALLVLHSDGLSAHWSLDKYPGLIRHHPSVIAGVLFRDFRRVRDDATVVVAREGGANE